MLKKTPYQLLLLSSFGLFTGATCQGAAVPAATVPAAARILDQATFGPTLNDISHVQSEGVTAYVNEQLAMPVTLLPTIANPAPAACSSNPDYCLWSEFWSNSLNAPDQLRQRVAFALSNIWVTSVTNVTAYAGLTYYNLLLKDAFGNYRQVMDDMTKSTAMGRYLNMLNSRAPYAGQIADENYAREMLQLFTVGVSRLNADGTLQHDSSGNPIPVYTSAQIQAFAKVFTGWTYGTSNGKPQTAFPNNNLLYTVPMAPVASAHDTESKILLDGRTLPAGQSAEDDLEDALDDVFADENVAPFVCKQLIQHLVTSNPSPEYVARISAVFNNDGTGTRGNLKAVVKAILLDQEARAGDIDEDAEGGHLRDTILYTAAVMRALDVTSTFAKPTSQVAYQSISNYTRPVGEVPMDESSVFGFYTPGYMVPNTTLNAPEFTIENSGSVLDRLTLADQLVTTNHLYQFTVDLSATSPLGVIAKQSPANLVDTLGMMFMHGQMPSQMRSIIIDTVTPIKDIQQRTRVATYLVITSSEYKIIH